MIRMGGELRTCTIITTEPNDVVRPLHHRMAVILTPDAYATWLSPNELPPDALQPLLRPYDAAAMEAYEVSTQVNNVANDSSALIDPVTPPPEQPSLL